MDDEVTNYGDTGPMTSGQAHPTGAGMKPDTLMVAGQPGTALPSRPMRSAANNAARTAGICGIAADDADMGVVDMRVEVPWA